MLFVKDIVQLALTRPVLTAEGSALAYPTPGWEGQAGHVTGTPGAASREGPGRSSGLGVLPKSP